MIKKTEKSPEPRYTQTRQTGRARAQKLPSHMFSTPIRVLPRRVVVIVPRIPPKLRVRRTHS